MCQPGVVGLYRIGQPGSVVTGSVGTGSSVLVQLSVLHLVWLSCHWFICSGSVVTGSVFSGPVGIGSVVTGSCGVHVMLATQKALPGGTDLWRRPVLHINQGHSMYL